MSKRLSEIESRDEVTWRSGVPVFMCDLQRWEVVPPGLRVEADDPQGGGRLVRTWPGYDESSWATLDAAWDDALADRDAAEARGDGVGVAEAVSELAYQALALRYAVKPKKLWGLLCGGPADDDQYHAMLLQLDEILVRWPRRVEAAVRLALAAGLEPTALIVPAA